MRALTRYYNNYYGVILMIKLLVVKIMSLFIYGYDDKIQAMLSVSTLPCNVMDSMNYTEVD